MFGSAELIGGNGVLLEGGQIGRALNAICTRDSMFSGAGCASTGSLVHQVVSFILFGAEKSIEVCHAVLYRILRIE